MANFLPSPSTGFYLISTNDLEEYHDGDTRAYCPIHGSDHQRSLEIDTSRGKDRGFGWCHNCNEIVLLVDLNPEAEQRIKEKDAREQDGSAARSPVDIERRVKERLKREAQRKPRVSYDNRLILTYQERMRRALDSARPRAYLEQRGVPYELAVEQGLMYLPVIPAKRQTPELKSLSLWYDHIVFPLSSTLGKGFIGRSVRLWTPGMNETEHRDLLKEHERQERDRQKSAGEKWRLTGFEPYMKTNPAGYFRFNEVVKQYAEIVIVEGSFDGMACLRAGITNVIALGGVALNVKMLPSSVKSAVIALDSDATGKAKSEKLYKDLRALGIDARIVPTPDDSQGKDWSERYRRVGKDGLAPLLPVPIEEDESVDRCAECHTPIPNPVPEDQIDNPYYTLNYTDEGTPYCIVCRPVNDAVVPV